jgi:hypothetical protein
VKDVSCAFRQLDTLLVAIRMKEADLDRVGDFGSHRKVGSVIAYGDAERVVTAFEGIHPILLPRLTLHRAAGAEGPVRKCPA